MEGFIKELKENGQTKLLADIRHYLVADKFSSCHAEDVAIDKLVELIDKED